MMRFPVRLLVVPAALLAVAGRVPDTGMGAVAGTMLLMAFNEGAGTTTADSSGAGLTATLDANSTPLWTAGRTDGALDFSPNQSCVRLTTALTMPTSWTIQVWAKFPISLNSSGYNYLVTGEAASRVHILVNGNLLGCWNSGWHTSGCDITGYNGWHL